MPSAALGAWVLGFVWGALAATIVVRRRWLLDVLSIAAATMAVVAAVMLVAGERWTAAHVMAAAVAGWVTRRTLESIVEGRTWT